MKEIAIIGGGLGGCLSALMLAKKTDKHGDPLYHITLIEKQPRLLNGASVIASRLHLGGEYPLSPDTAVDCLFGAVVWKLLMPENIYTKVPAMKFLIASETEKNGRECDEEATQNPSFRKTKAYQDSLTLGKFETAYKKTKRIYMQIFERAGKVFNHDAQKNLFGSPNNFYRTLEPHEYAYDEQKNFGYTDVAGGFQTLEVGINVPKYLTLIDKEIKAQEKAGRIALKLGRTVPENGIIAPKGNEKKFYIDAIRGGEHDIKPYDLVIVSAWQGGFNLPTQKKPAVGEKTKVIGRVHKRAMLRVDLPEGFHTPPAFIMLGEHGGMLCPYNDKVAICYLPKEDIAYIKSEKLTNYHPHLPNNWNDMTEKERANREHNYFEEVKKRFPILKHAKNPHLIIRDTVSFEPDLADRTHQAVTEQLIPTKDLPSVRQEQLLLQMMTGEHEAPVIQEETPGLFKVFPTKATYAPYSALQIVKMVQERCNIPGIVKVHAPERRETLDLILDEEKLKQYSLKDMGKPEAMKNDPALSNKDFEPSQGDTFDFFNEHPDLTENMLIDSWPVTPSATMADKVANSRRHRETNR